jgi:hypothetical protein
LDWSWPQRFNLWHAWNRHLWQVDHIQIHCQSEGETDQRKKYAGISESLKEVRVRWAEELLSGIARKKSWISTDTGDTWRPMPLWQMYYSIGQFTANFGFRHTSKGNQADEWLLKNLHHKFDLWAALVFGNWLASDARYHEPVRGKCLRRMLLPSGFEVCLIDEYKTCKTCPSCHQATLETFQTILNPRPSDATTIQQ